MLGWRMGRGWGEGGGWARFMYDGIFEGGCCLGEAGLVTCVALFERTSSTKLLFHDVP